MKKYQVSYKGRTYISRGENCEDAMNRFANRQVFGQRALIERYRTREIDADTRGENWAVFVAGWPNEEHLVSVWALHWTRG